MPPRPTCLAPLRRRYNFGCGPPFVTMAMVALFAADCQGQTKLLSVHASGQVGTGDQAAENGQAAERATSHRRPEKKPQRFVRILRDDKQSPVALQTSIVRYGSPTDKGLVVDLIGAIHVGESAYYRQLNRRFEAYDAVLYELVAPSGTRIPKGGVEPGSTVGYIQNGMTQVLGLAFQLNCIDYTSKNLVHADMSPAEFSDSMSRRGESVGNMFFRMIGQSIVQQSAQNQSQSDLKMLAALLADDRELELRRVMAEQFSNLDGAMLAFNGPDGSTLITERNKKALSVLRQQIDGGHKRLGIFFGAGHFDDMAQRLESEFGLKFQQSEWLTAWDLTERE